MARNTLFLLAGVYESNEGATQKEFYFHGPIQSSQYQYGIDDHHTKPEWALHYVFVQT